MSISDITLTERNNDRRSVASVYTAHVVVPPPVVDKIERFRNKRFLTLSNNKWRILFFIILLINCTIMLSPLWTKSRVELELKGTIIHDAVKGENILRVMYALIAVVIPDIFDTLLDLMHYREVGVSWDIHERVSFLTMSFVLPLMFIMYANDGCLPFLYVAINQSTSLCCLIAINSMISKLEGKKLHGMILCVITSILFGCSALYKVKGLFDAKYEDTGVQLAYSALSLQAVTNLYWFLTVVSSKLNHTNLSDWNTLHGILSNIKSISKTKLYFNNIESTVLFYFFILVLYGICTVIINTITDGVKWVDSNEANLIGLSLTQIAILVLISGIPTRWFRCEQILVHETLAELKDYPVPIHADDNDEVTITTYSEAIVRPECNTLATVFFADLTDVIESSNLPADLLLQSLDILYTIFDYCTTLFLHLGLEKIEVEGNFYMVVCDIHKNHAEIVANYAVVVRRAISLILHPTKNTQFLIRMGLHSGNLLSAKMGFMKDGRHKVGKTIDVAKDLAKSCEFGQIWCSINTASYITKAAGDDGILLPVNLKKIHDKCILDKGINIYIIHYHYL